MDTSILWRKLCKGSIWMNFPSWLKYVQELTDTRGLDIHDVREALILCGKPSRPVLPFDKSALTNRLTDVSRYFEMEVWYWYLIVIHFNLILISAGMVEPTD